MSKAGSASKIKLNTFDDLFGAGAQDTEIKELSVRELHSFKSHPFKVVEDDSLMELAESIKENGVMVPVIVRKRAKAGYEIISGHRRKRACEIAGIDNIPARIVDLSDDEAVIYMVDTNLCREKILPSEKAWAYRLKLEALKHKGKAADMLSIDKVAENAPDSQRKIQRLIRLTYLAPELLEMVDEGTLAFIPAVEVSYLAERSQNLLLDILQEGVKPPDVAKAQKLRETDEKGQINEEYIRLLLSEEKGEMRSFTLKGDHIRKYFPNDFNKKQIEEVILELLEDWKNRQ